ncbi:hypothetical protein [Rhodopirellula sp. MGV]|uniref:hypothetical protein n=1 Tax=Rhodopirellula sp. MGV TaxID=2023130 RepID=UPI000B95C9AC|nr:hypothetical protein [Rhodopirellula sp. MGV]OYP34960.1 hypothetical protein CGZ80_13140 [Rhodopirellula sp. MGV]PNY38145.1 hypothetical protein C2E31_03810 [Rhodopirellula baltica]
MDPETNGRQRLQLSQANIVAIAIVLAVGWVGANRIDQRRNQSSFDSMMIPDVHALKQDQIKCDPLQITIDAPADFTFYSVNETPPELSTISFVNHHAKLVGRIDSFDPARSAWPPHPSSFQPHTADQFSDNKELENDVVVDLDQPIDSLAFGTLTDSRLQVCSVMYQHIQVEWVSPMKSASWPFRIHQGRCELENKTLLISVFELDSKTPTPVYDQGPIAAIADAIIPNG